MRSFRAAGIAMILAGELKLLKEYSFRDSSMVVSLSQPPGDTDDEYELVALRKDGSILKSRDFTVSPIIDGPRHMTLARFQGVTEDQVKTFVVWSRKLKWVTIGGFATQPATQPTQPTAAELARDEIELKELGIVRR